jgi:hypothetical protein
MRFNCRSDFTAFYIRGTNIQLVAIRDHQNLVNFDRGAFFGIQFFNAAQIAFSDLVLFTTCSDHCVHGLVSKSFTEKPRILAILAACGKHCSRLIWI